MKKDLIIFCRVAWMKYYQGICDDDLPVGGGSFVKDYGDAHEACNFLPYRHDCYGYVQKNSGSLNLERIAGGKYLSDWMDGVTVVWVAKRPSGKSVIVGWYENATAYRDFQTLTGCQNGDGFQNYYFKAHDKNCVLLPVEARNFEIPRAAAVGAGQGMGQENVWYADTEQASVSRDRVFDYIKGYSGEKESLH